MAFHKFGGLFTLKNRRQRPGSPADRGKVVRLPPQTGSTAAEGGHHPIKRIIPGIIAGAADLDPAAVLTATVAGASFGLSLGWVVLLCIPILMSVFGVSARVGHETRLGLIKLVRENFGTRFAVTLASMVVAVNAKYRRISEAPLALSSRLTIKPLRYVIAGKLYAGVRARDKSYLLIEAQRARAAKIQVL